MQTPDRSGFSRQGLVVLDENTSDASLCVSPRVEGFAKKSAHVGEFLRSKQLYAFEWQRFRAPFRGFQMAGRLSGAGRGVL
jgi:hypothetical protein